MLEKVQKLIADVEVFKTTSKDEIEAFRIKYLGSKGLLKELFNEFDLLEILPDAIKQDKLIIFLLRNGYIDENYYDYISYFHGVSMTRNDNEFLQSVKSLIPNEFNYKLEKSRIILQKLLF